jgi:hypothetical protein
MQAAHHRPNPQTAIRIDLGAIFVSMELSRSLWLITSLSPGAGEKMSKHSVRSGDVGGLLTRFAHLQEKARAGLGLKSREVEGFRPPEPMPDARGIVAQPPSAATGCEFEPDIGLVHAKGSDLGSEWYRGDLCHDILTRNILTSSSRCEPCTVG